MCNGRKSLRNRPRVVYDCEMPTNVQFMVKMCEACQAKYQPASPRNKTCQTCTPDKSWVHRWRRYRITKPQFDAILEKQGGLCALCLIELKLDINTCVDHCHSSLRVRGILCRGCNMVVARFEDDEYMFRVEMYLNDAMDAEDDDLERG